jgi:5-formaminoimidazole-4-carboxamide-1-beta-D-ribofuranosyl 5'-monophosphate synthetase
VRDFEFFNSVFTKKLEIDSSFLQFLFYIFQIFEKIKILKKNSTNADTRTHMSTHPYKYTYTHHIPMSTSERLKRLDLEIHEVGHQERLAVDGDVACY